jgi:hypothetical protein
MEHFDWTGGTICFFFFWSGAGTGVTEGKREGDATLSSRDLVTRNIPGERSPKMDGSTCKPRLENNALYCEREDGGQ